MTAAGLLEWRTRHRLTQAAAARLVCCSAPLWSRCETAGHPVPLWLLRMLDLIDGIDVITGERDALLAALRIVERQSTAP